MSVVSRENERHLEYTDFIVDRKGKGKVIALAGNPNVGKSTVFNYLTGLKQHTGNWTGKTVSNAQGSFQYHDKSYILVDIPGTYSLMAHSAEEEIARDFICFGGSDAIVVVCDATCLERNLNLVLQILEVTDKVVVCINLMDEAIRKNININLDKLYYLLGVPVVATKAREGKGFIELLHSVEDIVSDKMLCIPEQIKYHEKIEEAITILEAAIMDKAGVGTIVNARWLALRLLDADETFFSSLTQMLKYNLLEEDDVSTAFQHAISMLEENGFDKQKISDSITSSIVLHAECIFNKSVKYNEKTYNQMDRKIDRILMNKWLGFPIMILLFAMIFWITIIGANYPSKLLADGLFWIEDRLVEFALWIGAPAFLYKMLIFGVYRVVAWVVSVMLPPMAIFFPLFTLLEDLGYLPRVAFVFDKCFKKCNACGKQILTMCMGLGCNAVGVTGCRIIDSPRERLIAILTNNFIPCNGRFPTLITISTMFFTAYAIGPFQSFVATFFLTALIALGIVITFISSKILSKTLLKGTPSSFTLELPPYRKPQVGKVILRSLYNRTIFVLARAVCVAAPAGLIIWLLANIKVGNVSILASCSEFLDPFARLMGLDGVILLAFILGFPANEIVIPIIIMAYMATGNLVELNSVSQLKELLVNNGWTQITAICTMLFSLMHWPCSTTCLTIKKETKSWKWTLLSMVLPTCMGVCICIIVATVLKLFV